MNRFTKQKSAVVIIYNEIIFLSPEIRFGDDEHVGICMGYAAEPFSYQWVCDFDPERRGKVRARVAM